MFPRFSLPTLARMGMLKSAFLGLFASSYLLYAYTAHRPIVCGASSGCEIVRLSKWAYVFGSVPRPLLGVAFYAAVLVCLFVRLAIKSHQKALWRVIQALAVIGLLESVVLFFVQWKEIGAFCMWCLLSAVASIGVAVAAALDRPLPADPTERTAELQTMTVLVGVLSVLFLGGLWWLLR